MTVYQLSQRSHSLHWPVARFTGEDTHTACGRRITGNSIPFDEHEGIPDARHCNNGGCSEEWRRFRAGRTRPQLRNDVTININAGNTTFDWTPRIEEVTNPVTIYTRGRYATARIGGHQVDRVIFDDVIQYSLGGAQPERECACGDRRNKHYHHAAEGCDHLG